MPWKRNAKRFWSIALVAVVAIVLIAWWVIERATSSMTDDAFIEAHIVNLAPRRSPATWCVSWSRRMTVSNRGQFLAEIDPVPYRDQVELARSKVEGAEAELRRQQAALDRLRLEVPIQIEISRRTACRREGGRSPCHASFEAHERQVEQGVEEAQAGLEAATADLVLAQQEYTRFTALEKQEAVPLRRSQEVTRTRDAAEAHRNLAATKLAKAEADRSQIEVAKRTLEAAEKSTQKAAKGVDLAETGNAQIREIELLTAVKKEDVTEAQRALAFCRGPAQVHADPCPLPGRRGQALPASGRFRLGRRPDPQHVQSRPALRHREPGRDAPRGRRPGQPRRTCTSTPSPNHSAAESSGSINRPARNSP